MQAEPVIVVEGVSKAYRIWENPAARLVTPFLQAMANWLPPLKPWLHRKADSHYRDFWALQNVSFTLRAGESFGIIGRNGSGKSTLLQIIAGTLRATSGRAVINGRVAALLELGSGFNPDFTGRENVYLNAAVLGLAKRTIDDSFADIAAFADIGDFMDQPVKTYSSGMMVRLAFAVQTAVNPEILIIDEALSVGDESFQRKCFARIEALKAKGTTLLFVSHSAHQVIELCDRAMLLTQGKVVVQGTPKEVVKIYHQEIYGRSTLASAPSTAVSPAAETGQHWTITTENRPAENDDSLLGDLGSSSSVHLYPEAGARIEDVALHNEQGVRVNHLRRGCQYTYSYRVTVLAPLHGVRFGAVIKTLAGLELAGMASHPDTERLSRISAETRYRVRFHFRCGLLPGVYFLNAGVLALDGSGAEYFAHRLIDAQMFRVMPETDLTVNALTDLFVRAEICDLNPTNGVP